MLLRANALAARPRFATRGNLCNPFRRWQRRPTILVFDSGLGGLTVFREVAKARPDARFVYAADDAFFPYGRQDEARLVARVLDVMEQLIAAHRPDLVVIACNTASTLVLAAAARTIHSSVRRHRAGDQAGLLELRAASSCRCSAPKRRSSANTPARSSAIYGNGCAVTLVGSPRLAELAEAELKGEPVADADIAAEIAPCFVEADGAAHRHRGAGLHPLSAAARPPAKGSRPGR